MFALLLPPLSTGVSQDLRTPFSRPGDTELPEAEAGSQPYLRAIGPPPLRFLELEVQSRIAPPISPTLSVGALPTAGKRGDSSQPAAAKDARAPAVATTAQAPQRQEIQVASRPAPPPIVPDEAAGRVKPEDFLPFFQYPGGQRPGQPDEPAKASSPPTPGQLPPSSATYRQE